MEDGFDFLAMLSNQNCALPNHGLDIDWVCDCLVVDVDVRVSEKKRGRNQEYFSTFGMSSILHMPLEVRTLLLYHTVHLRYKIRGTRYIRDFYTLLQQPVRLDPQS